MRQYHISTDHRVIGGIMRSNFSVLRHHLCYNMAGRPHVAVSCCHSVRRSIVVVYMGSVWMAIGHGSCAVCVRVWGTIAVRDDGRTVQRLSTRRENPS